MFKHILLPTDGSDPTMRAINTAIKLAAQLGARIHALHVLTPLPAVSFIADVLQGDIYRKQACERAETNLAKVREMAHAVNVVCDVEYLFDNRPYVAIAGAATKYHCDLIVMDAHECNNIERLLLSNTTHKVILSCDVPVLVCH
ncbi:universal stress protein [Dyella subtropica]|uniref:universal stress protein n=1 Tax=Dyella subtropica TaxID=2992127 RepID=UPI00225B859B|nr:universal stress protein [Dyella subtropica]